MDEDIEELLTLETVIAICDDIARDLHESVPVAEHIVTPKLMRQAIAIAREELFNEAEIYLMIGTLARALHVRGWKISPDFMKENRAHGQ